MRRLGGRPRSPISPTKVDSDSPVDSRILATLSVLGQRALPPGAVRLLLLNVVGSRPERRASPEGERPCFSARRSIARQMSLCRSISQVLRRTADLSATKRWPRLHAASLARRALRMRGEYSSGLKGRRASLGGQHRLLDPARRLRADLAGLC